MHRAKWGAVDALAKKELIIDPHMFTAPVGTIVSWSKLANASLSTLDAAVGASCGAGGTHGVADATVTCCACMAARCSSAYGRPLVGGASHG